MYRPERDIGLIVHSKMVVHSVKLGGGEDVEGMVAF